jgi:hypothetical protein
MRYYRSATVTLSEDNSSDPKEIRFSDVNRVTKDTTGISDSSSGTHSVSAGDTFTLPMGQITLGKYLFLLSDAEFTLSIDGATALTMAADVVSELWAEFTTINIGAPADGEGIRLTWAIGGD